MKHKHKKPKKMPEVTGYYIDLPEGAQEVAEVNSEEINQLLADYELSTPGVIYSLETDTLFGVIEWDDSVEILSAVIDNTAVTVNELIGGAHAPQRPK